MREKATNTMLCTHTMSTDTMLCTHTMTTHTMPCTDTMSTHTMPCTNTMTTNTMPCTNTMATHTCTMFRQRRRRRRQRQRREPEGCDGVLGVAVHGGGGKSVATTLPSYPPSARPSARRRSWAVSPCILVYYYGGCAEQIGFQGGGANQLLGLPTPAESVEAA